MLPSATESTSPKGSATRERPRSIAASHAGIARHKFCSRPVWTKFEIYQSTNLTYAFMYVRYIPEGRGADWSAWSAWTVCCEDGSGQLVKERTRSCDNPPPIPGTSFCSGKSRETRECGSKKPYTYWQIGRNTSYILAAIVLFFPVKFIVYNAFQSE